MNNVTLIGRLVADPDLKMTAAGTPVASFRLAVRRPFAKEGQQEADFINCVAWRKTAELLNKYCRKGQRIGVTGTLQSRTYEKDGIKHYITEVLAQTVEFLESSNGHSAKSDPFDAVPPPSDDDLSYPF